MVKRRISKIKGKKNTSIRCPQCNSTDVTYYMGAQFGKYQCKLCNYIGVIIVEK